MTVRRRVAILGGGCAGVAAALRLTRTAELRARFDVTIHQQGWRLGGKAASGRVATSDRRLEEHGLHLWMGWYFRAFGIVRDLFAEWKAPAGSPLRDCASAFSPFWDITLVERHAGALLPWTVRLPPKPGHPWDDDFALGRTALAVGNWLGALAFDDESGLPALLRHPGTFLRRAGLSARLAGVLLRGWNRDVRPYGEAGYARIDHLDFRAWLVQHGGDSVDITDAPPVRALYDLAFAPDGGMAAGAALRTLLHVATGYRGAPFYRLRYGMGDTLFSPALDVLRARGVRVEFLHRVDRLRVSDGRLDGIDVRRQATTRGNLPLDARVKVRGLEAWLAEPPWDALENGDALRANGVNFERASCAVGEEIHLERGRDFDVAILALPAPACADVVSELCATSERWRAMMASSATVATRAVQLWLTRSATRGGQVMVGHAHPLASIADMSEVLDAEGWNEAGGPQSIVMMCDALADGLTASDVTTQLDAWLEQGAGRIWPGFSREWLAVPPMVKANAEGSDRYVLTPPGSTAHRLDVDSSGVSDLFLAGDWVRTSINGGSVEAAFEAGQRAADALAANL